MSQPTPPPAPAGDLEATVRARLAVLAPARVELIDDSLLHAGHAGAQGGGRHYRLLIVADEFSGKSKVIRHQLVYGALGDLMQCRIHALSIRALTPSEAEDLPD